MHADSFHSYKFRSREGLEGELWRKSGPIDNCKKLFHIYFKVLKKIVSL